MKVAICIPTLPTRRDMLARALKSVERQRNLPPGCHVVSFVHTDKDRCGAWHARNQALRSARDWEPDWIGFLDDDDELYADHVSTLLGYAEPDRYDIVWGWFNIPGTNRDPFAKIVNPDGSTGYRGRQYDPATPHVVPITYMARASYVYEALDDMGGFQPDTPGSGGVWDTQDMPLMNAMHVAGARSLAVGECTWIWHHHGRNTSGMPDKN